MTIPARRDSNLLVGTWNIRALGDLTGKWAAGPNDSPKRDWHAVACLAEVISLFDVVAVQESRRNPKALKHLLATLGPQWQVIISDVTEGSAGNGERLAYLYDSGRVQVSGLVGEIVLPPVGDDPSRQFARTPYSALRQLHPRRGRIYPRVRARAVGQEPCRAVAGNHRLRPMDAGLGGTSQRLELEPDGAGGLQPGQDRGPALRGVHRHRPVAAHGAGQGPADHLRHDRTQHFYDQIAWFSKADGTSLLEGLAFGQRAGSFDFIPHIYRGLTRTEVSWRISDHYPLWCEFLLE